VGYVKTAALPTLINLHRMFMRLVAVALFELGDMMFGVLFRFVPFLGMARLRAGRPSAQNAAAMAMNSSTL
jgi:hypothetical protein